MSGSMVRFKRAFFVGPPIQLAYISRWSPSTLRVTELFCESQSPGVPLFARGAHDCAHDCTPEARRRTKARTEREQVPKWPPKCQIRARRADIAPFGRGLMCKTPTFRESAGMREFHTIGLVMKSRAV